MEINKTLDGKILLVALTDRLDTIASQQLSDSLKEDVDKIDNIIFNFTQLSYISSAGLRVLLSYQKLLGGKEKVTLKTLKSITN